MDGKIYKGDSPPPQADSSFFSPQEPRRIGEKAAKQAGILNIDFTEEPLL